jgi:hypothetical protein
MSVLDILVILGCVAVGYWIVSSVMGPGIDITRQPPDGDNAARPETDQPRETPRQAAPRPQAPHRPQRSADQRPAAPRALPRPAPSGPSDWYLLLDISRGASRREIEAAFQHQLRKAQDARDTLLQDRLRRAREAGLAQAK